MNKKIFIFMFLMVFLVGSVSAVTFNSIDDKIIFKNEGKYGTYEINDTTFWFFNNKPVKTIELLENEYSVFKAWNIKEIELFRNAKLFDKTDYYGEDKSTDKSKHIRGEKHFYREWEEKEREINQGYCENYEYFVNGSIESCLGWIDTSYNETYGDWSKWKEYNFDTKQPGLYQTRTEVFRDNQLSGIVDWIDTNDGHKLEEWASWWNDSWQFKRLITLNSDIGNFSYLDNITYDSDMQVNFSDIRFVDSATESVELNYTIERKIDSDHAEVRVFSQGASTFYMYYGNAVVSSTGSASDTYFNPAHMYYMDEQSGTNAEDIIAGNNGTSTGATAGAIGNINNSFSFDGLNDYMTMGATLPTGANDDFTLYLDYYPTSFSCDEPDACEIWTQYANGADSGRTLLRISPTGVVSYFLDGITIIANNTLSTGQFQSIVVRRSSGTLNLIIDKELRATGSNSVAVLNSNTILGMRGVQNKAFIDGREDELKIYDYALTDERIIQLSSATEPAYTIGNEQENLNLVTTLLNPTDDSNSTIDFISFNYTSSPVETNLTNTTFYIWYNNGTLLNTNFTTLSGNESVNTTILYNTNSEGIFLWNAETCGVGANCEFASNNFTLTVHTTSPSVSILSPTGIFEYIMLGDNLTLNWSITEPGVNLTEHILSCSYGYNGSVTIFNNSVCTEINETSFTYVLGENNLTFNVTDSFGLVTTDTTSWGYTIFDYDNYTFTSPVVEGTDQNYIGYFNINESFTEIKFYYNNTNYSNSINSLGNDDYRLTGSLRVPNVDADVNNSFFWSIIGSTINTTAQNQTVVSIDADDCSVFTFLLMNQTLVDEEEETIINNSNSSIEIDLQLYPSTGTETVLNFSETYMGTPYAPVCVDNNLTGSSINMYSQTRYTSDDYVAEFYNIQKLWLNETTLPILITLFDLLADDATEFEITYKSATFLPVPDAIININRKYVGQGIYQSVEIPLTDANGKTKANFDLNGVLYQFIVSKDGVVLATFNNPTIFCENELSGDCTIILNELSGVEELLTMEEANNLLYELSRDNRTITLDFIVPSGASRTINLVVNKQDRFLNDTQCNETLVSSSGSISCEVPISLGDVFVDVIVRVDNELLTTGSSTLLEDRNDIFNGNNIVLVFFLILSLVLMGLSSGMVTLIGLVLGIMVSGLMLLINSGSLFGATSVVLFILSTVVVLGIKMAGKQ